MRYGSTTPITPAIRNGPRKISLLGIAGCGKSALGSLLLGDYPDHKTKGLRAGDSACGSDVEVLEGGWLGDPTRSVRIIDTPGCGKGEIEDKKSMRKIVEAFREEQTMHAFIWVKNSQEPRYSQQEAEFFAMLKKIVGPNIFHNLLMVFSFWSFDEEEERERERNPTGMTLESAKQELWDSFVQYHPEVKTKTRVPIKAVDSFYRSEDEMEALAFRDAVDSLWEEIGHLDALDVVIEERPRKICIIGLTRCGKSAFGNALIQNKHDTERGEIIPSHPTSDSISRVKVLDGHWLGDPTRRVRIIDTPGCGKGNAEDKRSMEEIIRALRREKVLDAFIWVKNFRDPQYDQREADFLAMLTKATGVDLFHNFVIVFVKQEDRHENRSAIDFEVVQEELWDSLVQRNREYKRKPRLPMIAVDLFYDARNQPELDEFKMAVNSLWKNASSLGVMYFPSCNLYVVGAFSLVGVVVVSVCAGMGGMSALAAAALAAAGGLCVALISRTFV